MPKSQPADDLSTDLVIRLDAIKGTLDLAHEAVINNAARNDELTSAHCAIDLARAELERLADEIGGRLGGAPRLVLIQSREVANG